MNIIFFDINKEFIDEAKRLAKYGIQSMLIDVKQLIDSIEIDMIVSPANSFGYMNGGIDKIYTELFSGIQTTVQNKINELGFISNLGKKYLPIGSAITVKTNNKKCEYLISAPTMYLPGSIQQTNNIIFCFMAILNIANKNKNKKIACPGLGTNIGCLKAKEAIDQIEFVIKNFDQLIINNNYLNRIAYCDDYNIVLQ